MHIHEKDWLLIQVQLDHLSGEDIGGAIDEFYAAGAANVQVIPTITKKNRPGHIFQIDTHPSRQDAVETVIVRELRSSGWHVFETKHRHLNVDYLCREALFSVNGDTFSLNVEAKKLYGTEITIRPEDRSCEALKREAARHGASLSRAFCRETIRNIFSERESSALILLKEIDDVR